MKPLIVIALVVFSILACSNETSTGTNQSELPAPLTSNSAEETSGSLSSTTSESIESTVLSSEDETSSSIQPVPTPKAESTVNGVAPTAVPETLPPPTGAPAVNSPTPTAAPEALPTPTVASAVNPPTPTATPIPAPAPMLKPLDFTASQQFNSFTNADQAAFQEALNRAFETTFPQAGVSVAVFDGSRLWTSGVGKATETEIMTPETPMIIRSTSKTVLGALITDQINRGLYDLNATIESLLNDHEDYHLINIDNVNVKVTVRQLLTMTSGISDWSSATDLLKRIEIMTDANWKPANNLKQISELFVEPGSYHYSYANSILLGLIAEHKDGRAINTIYQETFFEPLGIVAGLLPDIPMPVHTAVSYDDLSLYQLAGQEEGVGFGPMNSGSMAPLYGHDSKVSWAGAGIVSTAENIARWGYELFSPSGSAVSTQVRQQLLDAMTIPTDSGLTSLGMHTYGHYMGTGEVSASDGTLLKVYTHPGGGGGRTSWLYYAPELNVSISLLANSLMLHKPGNCNYRGRTFMTNGECIGGGIFSRLLGK
jgi:CubicO group peptidase (beta-lactamase class C family)